MPDAKQVGSSLERDLRDLEVLRDFFAGPPTLATWERLRVLVDSDPAWAVIDDAVRSPCDSVELRSEWMRLFEGPGRFPVPLYGSVYLDDGLLMGSSTRSVREFYQRWGVEPVASIPADHLAFELGFLGFLTSRISAGGEGLNGEPSIQARARFAGQWMLPWLVTMSDSLKKAHADALFVGVAEVLLAVIERLA
ncbi:MAG: TorD/DmsD family molecular chaperone [Acidimicrobiales bacterium]